jgi:hypothetical protein
VEFFSHTKKIEVLTTAKHNHQRFFVSKPKMVFRGLSPGGGRENANGIGEAKFEKKD